MIQIILTRNIGPRRILDIEANEILEIQEDCVKRIELISEPEICKAHIEEGRAKDATHNA